METEKNRFYVIMYISLPSYYTPLNLRVTRAERVVAFNALSQSCKCKSWLYILLISLLISLFTWIAGRSPRRRHQMNDSRVPRACACCVVVIIEVCLHSCIHEPANCAHAATLPLRRYSSCNNYAGIDGGMDKWLRTSYIGNIRIN
jgi:hypothetical protein